MEVLRFKRKGLRIAQVWFNEYDDLDRYDTIPADLLEFMNSTTALQSRLSPFKNGVIELAPGLDAVYDTLDKGFKYEVRRAEKENIMCEELKDPDASTLREIFTTYSVFSLEKKIDVTPLQLFELYKNAGALKISIAKLGEDILQYHLYFSTADEIILLASFPADKTVNLKKSLIGYANRALHWHDIQKAHASGLKKYNLGGIGNFENAEKNGIIKFKLEMAPKTRLYYNGIIPRSVWGKFYLKVKTRIKKYVQ